MTTKEQILKCFKDIDHAYNDCTRYDTLKRMLDELQEPSEDCINRKDVNILVDELARAISDERCCMPRGRSTGAIMQDILDLSSVTPKPKIGHWNLVQRGKCIDICCTNCGYIRVKDYAYNYTVDQISEQDIKDFFSNSNINFCENCGEKMQEDEE